MLRTFTVLLLLPLLAGAQQPPSRDEVLVGVKDLEKNLGFERTGNFAKRSEIQAVSYRCYYTGKLELPASYDELGLLQASDCAATIDSAKYDLFYYPMEAVASGKTPVTAGLESASMERFLMVVPHEDFHDSSEVARLPTAIGEAAATLVGFLTAAEYARERFGAESETYRNLAREPAQFLAKAQLVNRYYAELSGLYAGVREGRTSEAEALAQKGQAFAALTKACLAITPEPRSFNRCPSIDNNAGLAFDSTYTRYYPLLYAVYEAQRQDFRTTLERLRRVFAGGRLSEADAVRYLEAAAGRR